MLQGRNIIFNIPPLTSEFIFPAQLYLDDNDTLVVSEESNTPFCKLICRFSILHSIIGDINKFHISCRGFKSDNHNCNNILEPIFRKYCDDNLIDFDFYCLNYE
jgi:hypothetical protein